MCFNLLLVLKRVKKKKKSLKDSEKKCRALISSWYQQLASRCSHMRPIAEGHRTPPIPQTEKLMRVWAYGAYHLICPTLTHARERKASS